MKRKQLFLLEMIAGVLLFVIAAVVMVPKFLNSQNLNSPHLFPDDALRAKIERILRIPPGERFTREDLMVIRELDVQSIKNLKGIQVLPNLERLYITNRSAQELHLPVMPKLLELYCSDNALTQLDLTGFTNLQILDISSNQFTEFSINGTPHLTELDCSSNLIRKLDLTIARKLEWLDCSNNLLESIDFSQNPELNTVYGSLNVLSGLDLSNNQKLMKLTCWENPITALDVSHNPMLSVLNASRCGLSEIDFSRNKLLEAVLLSSNDLHDVPNIPRPSNLRLFYMDMNLFTDEDWKDVQEYQSTVKNFVYYPQKNELPAYWRNQSLQ